MATPERAPLGAAIAVVIALVTLTGPLMTPLMIGITALLVLLVALGWAVLLELSTPRSSAVVILMIGWLALASVVVTANAFAPLHVLAMCGAVGLVTAFLQQMVRRHRVRLTASLTGTVSGMLVALVSSTWLIAAMDAAAVGLVPVVTSASAGLALALLAFAAPLPDALRAPFGIVAGTAAVVAVGMSLTAATPTVLAALGALGLVVTLSAAAAHRLLGSLLRARAPLAALAVAATPLATAGVVVLIGVRAIAALS